MKWFLQRGSRGKDMGGDAKECRGRRCSREKRRQQRAAPCGGCGDLFLTGSNHGGAKMMWSQKVL